MNRTRIEFNVSRACTSGIFIQMNNFLMQKHPSRSSGSNSANRTTEYGLKRDATPENDKDRKPLSHFLIDSDVIVVMKKNIQSSHVSTSWYNENREIAQWFFPGPVYPRMATELFGFPGDDSRSAAVGFNDPDDYVEKEAIEFDEFVVDDP